MSTVYVGIDNGPSGSIGIFNGNETPIYIEAKTVTMFEYTKKKQMITVLQFRRMYRLFRKLMMENEQVAVAMERPMVNPLRFVATKTAMRVHQQYLDIFDLMKHPEPMFLDSREWQKKYLPSGTKGPELKTASAQIGKRMFPSCAAMIDKHGDADGLFLAFFLKQKME